MQRDETTKDEQGDETADEGGLRARIVAAAAALVASGGPSAATTRAVAAAAGVQAPALYRLFGDKRGLLSAVVDSVMRSYVADKAARPANPDPLEDLREGWRVHIAFSLEHPGIFAILTSEPHVPAGDAVLRGGDVLQRRIHNLATAGRLRVTEARALDLVRAMGTGVVHTLLRTREADRDPAFADAAFDVVAASIVGAAVKDGGDVGAAAVAVSAGLDDVAVLSAGERLLLQELLERIARQRR